MELILLRHAKSSWEEPYQSDWHRGLNPRGVKTLPKVVAQLQAWLPGVDRILTSDACRAQLTAEAVAQAFPQARLETLPELYGADSGAFKVLLERYWCEGEVQVWVGHNPTLELMVRDWLGGCIHKFPTAAMARVRLGSDGAIVGPIRLWTPKGGEYQLV
ncbi:histidine phosphatase family protein [Ferrimonas sp. YFM]|uniref:SixA phosphatase family protein n=1 Tax=Ferrimonas sp. YFM TaxID=3028878 RepID=UPI00257327BA|nr:histidine phosphatase family protein [Ferrimonas sp. YFM]BDY05562.1 phosphoglycerate mutase [Ferrimonas sp. YFM]